MIFKALLTGLDLYTVRPQHGSGSGKYFLSIPGFISRFSIHAYANTRASFFLEAKEGTEGDGRGQLRKGMEEYMLRKRIKEDS